MQNNCKGFTLIDALLGLSLFTLFFTFAYPSINDLIKERKHISERMFVVTTLNNELQHWLYDESDNLIASEVIVTPTNKELQLARQRKNDELKVCITWAITENRLEELCLYGFETN
jgi:type II secretory pathway pseudopilin PulG